MKSFLAFCAGLTLSNASNAADTGHPILSFFFMCFFAACIVGWCAIDKQESIEAASEGERQ